MSKKKRRKYPSSKQVTITGTDVGTPSDATLSPDDLYDSPTSSAPLGGDSTSAPTIGEEETEKYVDSPAGLADKYLLSKKTVPFSIALIICIIISGIVFVQDNQSGLLINIDAIIWTIKKCIIFFILTTLLWVVLVVFQYIRGKFEKYI